MCIWHILPPVVRAGANLSQPLPRNCLIDVRWERVGEGGSGGLKACNCPLDVEKKACAMPMGIVALFDFLRVLPKN